MEKKFVLDKHPKGFNHQQYLMKQFILDAVKVHRDTLKLYVRITYTINGENNIADMYVFPTENIAELIIGVVTHFVSDYAVCVSEGGVERAAIHIDIH